MMIEKWPEWRELLRGTVVEVMTPGDYTTLTLVYDDGRRIQVSAFDNDGLAVARIKLQVTARDEIRNATGTFGCPTCWPTHMHPLVPDEPTCPDCHAELEWTPETFKAHEYWQQRKRNGV